MELTVSIEKLVASSLTFKEFATLAVTSTRWKSCSDDERLWRVIYHGHFGSPASLGHNSDTVKWSNRLKTAVRVGRLGSLAAVHFSVQARARSGHTATVVESLNSVLLLAGASTDYRFRNDAELLDIQTGATRLLQVVVGGRPFADRWLHTATIMDDNIIIIGGQGQGGLHRQILSLRADGLSGDYVFCNVVDPLGVQCFDAIQGWAGHTANAWFSRILLFGGMRRDNSVTNSLVTYDYSAKMVADVATTGSVPSSRWCHSSAITCDLIIFAGWYRSAIERENQFLNDLSVLDLETLAWSAPLLHGVPPCPRCQTTLTILDDDFLLLFGGASHSDSDEPTYGDRVVDLDDFCVLDWKTKTWLATQSSYRPLRGGVNAVVDVGRGLLICGGMHSDPGATMPTFMHDIAYSSKHAWIGST